MKIAIIPFGHALIHVKHMRFAKDPGYKFCALPINITKVFGFDRSRLEVWKKL